jgi:hypothetical protein
LGDKEMDAGPWETHTQDSGDWEHRVQMASLLPHCSARCCLLGLIWTLHSRTLGFPLIFPERPTNLFWMLWLLLFHHLYPSLHPIASQDIAQSLLIN